MSIRAGASWGAIVLSAGLLAYAAQPASANLLTNGDFQNCVPALPLDSGFAVNTPATHNRWNGNGWTCTDTPAATGNATQYGRQVGATSTNEILQGVPLGSCVAPGDKVKLKLRYVYQGPDTITSTAAENAARLYSIAAGGTWSQFGPWAKLGFSELGSIGFPLRETWSSTLELTATVPDGAVALGVALRMGYQGSVTNIGDNIHGVDDVSLTLASFTANVNVDPNTLNLRSRGNDITAYLSVPVSECISASAGDIDRSTVKITSIDGTPVSLSATRSNLQGSVLMAKFSRQAVQAAIVGLGLTLPAFVDIVIEGELDDGTSFTATDQIRAINP
jgi:hypothetical protein